jgi:hypothetical protein
MLRTQFAMTEIILLLIPGDYDTQEYDYSAQNYQKLEANRKS